MITKLKVCAGAFGVVWKILSMGADDVVVAGIRHERLDPGFTVEAVTSVQHAAKPFAQVFKLP